MRISVTLVSATDGAVRWTDRYDRPLANVFAVQDEIARTVPDTLLGSLGHRPVPTVRTETVDPQAHALFLQGMVLFNRRGTRALHQAIALFEQAPPAIHDMPDHSPRSPWPARLTAAARLRSLTRPVEAPILGWLPLDDAYPDDVRSWRSDRCDAGRRWSSCTPWPSAGRLAGIVRGD